MGWNTSVPVSVRIVVCLFLVFCTASAVAQTQGATYAVSGRVRCVDQQGKPCSTDGITITLSGNVLGVLLRGVQGSINFLISLTVCFSPLHLVNRG